MISIVVTHAYRPNVQSVQPMFLPARAGDLAGKALP
jgi:hypothetical protein